MKESKIKLSLLALISLLVFTILFSNIGQNFKINISSYEDTVHYYNVMKSITNRSVQYQGFLNNNANYISRIMKANKFEPYINNKFIDMWNFNTPLRTSSSTLEVLDPHNLLIKKYLFGIDFLEDFRGNTTTGTVKSKASYQLNIGSIHKVLDEVLLFDGYGSTTNNKDISVIDAKLKSLGASGVISPMNADSPLSQAGGGYYYNDLIESNNGKGLAKFIANQSVFNELKNYAALGYTIKIKSGGEVKPITYKNIYGVIQGTNPSFKPLIIGVFYDGPYKISISNKYIMSKNYLLPASIMLDCLRVVNKQRLRKPDRTIIFAFLSGYSKSKMGLDHLLKINTKDNIIVFDGLGLNDNFSIDYSKTSVATSSSISGILKKFDFIVNSRAKNVNLVNSTIYVANTNAYKRADVITPNITRSNNTSHFVLSLIQEECYNLNFLTGNVAYFRTFERFIRSNSAILSILAIILLVLVLFFPVKKFKKNNT